MVPIKSTKKIETACNITIVGLFLLTILLSPLMSKAYEPDEVGPSCESDLAYDDDDDDFEDFFGMAASEFNFFKFFKIGFDSSEAFPADNVCPAPTSFIFQSAIANYGVSFRGRRLGTTPHQTSIHKALADDSYLGFLYDDLKLLSQHTPTT